MESAANGLNLEIRIDWGELDYYGHVNNVFFFKYAQTARVNFWDSIGLTQFHLETNQGPLLASCKCDFKKILRYPGNISVETSVAQVGNTSFSFLHRIYDQQGELAAEIQDTMVMFDYNKREKMRVPQWMREKFGSPH